MSIALAVVLVILSISIHELGHYEAMRRCGVKVKEVSLLGIPCPFLPSISIRIRNSETIWMIHPFLPIGAYVKPESDDEILSKSLKDQLYIYSNGIIANMAYAFAILAIIMIVLGISHEEARYDKVLAITFLFAGTAWLIWRLRRVISLALPILTIPLFLLTTYSIFSFSPKEVLEAGGGGPVAVIGMFDQAKGTLEAMVVAALISINLALMNLVPIKPLDGGHVFGAILKSWLGERSAKIHLYLSTVLFLGLIFYCLGLDAVRIWRWIW